jgi:hypothetical protein
MASYRRHQLPANGTPITTKKNSLAVVSKPDFFEYQASDGGYLNVQNDFGQMDHQVSCIFGSLANNALEYQIYDNNHHGTIPSGRIRAYQYDMFDVNSLRKAIDTPLPEPAGCQVS